MSDDNRDKHGIKGGTETKDKINDCVEEDEDEDD